MKKRRYISVAVCLLVAALVLVVKYHPRTVPIEECSQIYRDYADNPHVAVAFIKNFPVNDTLAADVTTLHALDTIGWDGLMHYFGYSEEMIEEYYNSIKRMESQPINQFVSFCVDKDNYSKRLPPSNNDSRLVIGSYKTQTFSFYYSDNNKVKDIIANTELKHLKQ